MSEPNEPNKNEKWMVCTDPRCGTRWRETTDKGHYCPSCILTTKVENLESALLLLQEKFDKLIASKNLEKSKVSLET